MTDHDDALWVFVFSSNRLIWSNFLVCSKKPSSCVYDNNSPISLFGCSIMCFQSMFVNIHLVDWVLGWLNHHNELHASACVQSVNRIIGSLINRRSKKQRKKISIRWSLGATKHMPKTKYRKIKSLSTLFDFVHRQYGEMLVFFSSVLFSVSGSKWLTMMIMLAEINFGAIPRKTCKFEIFIDHPNKDHNQYAYLMNRFSWKSVNAETGRCRFSFPNFGLNFARIIAHTELLECII